MWLGVGGAPVVSADGRPAKGTGARRLSPESQRILALENETVAGHTCKVIELDGPLDVGRLRASVAERLPRAPKLSMRLTEIDGAPWWVPDPQVDMTAQVVESGRSAAGDEAGFLATVSAIFAQHLDRSRPLWRIDVIPRMPGGGSALVWRIHHALADGLTAMRMAGTVLWDEQPAEGAASRALPGHGRGSANTLPVRAGSASDSRAASATGGAAAAEHHRLDGLLSAVREAPQPWLRSPFDGHIDGRRAVAFTTTGLGGLRQVAAATDGATVNDAVLAVVAGGLRRWLEAHHGHLGTVRVKVPVSLHSPPLTPGDADSEPGNRDSFFCLDLPLGSADPIERMAAIRSATRVRKQGHDAQHLDALMHRLGSTPRLSRFAGRILAHPRSFALNVSNVPGPRRPVRVLTVPVRALYSLAEIGEHHALRVAVVSLADSLNFGLVADPTLLDDVDQLATDMQAEAGALIASSRRED
jgi:diacylglycerol O-acyltransferase / wax synthase